ncbi:MAG: helix-turn-helix domain-containing protein [Dehalococcoidia bacterium]|nr:helix-turn-helix domain-containing protein [Dehalococcoidia bacterium]
MALIGRTLRDARLQRGLTIDQAAHDTRISARFLEALESESFDELPAPVYVRGFLRSYANYLRVDPEPLLGALASERGAPVSGPDAFVGGPRQAPMRGGRSDPFRRSPPPPPVAPPLPADDEATPEDEDEGWEAPAAVAIAAARGPDARGGTVPGPYPGEQEPYRSRRVSGMLTERPPAGGGGSRTARLLVLAAVAFVVLIGGIVAAVALSGGGGEKKSAAGTGSTATASPRTVVSVGTATVRPTASGTTSATPGVGTPATTTTPAPGTATPVGTPGAPTPTPLPGETPTPVSNTPTATPTVPPTATATPIPTATPTPRPPTPTPTPIVAHPFAYELCTGRDNCGDPPYRIVCAPDGWFLDKPRTFPASTYGWTVTSVDRLSLAPGACG